MWDVWSKNEKPAEANILQKIVSMFVGNLIYFGGSIILWTKFFVPGIAYMQGLLNITRFCFWIIFPIIACAMVIQLLAINKDKNEAFKKYALDSWHQKRSFYRAISRLNLFTIVLGLALNGYFISAIFTFTCILVTLFVRAGIRTEIQKIMNKITPSEDNDIIEAEYRIA